MSFNVEQELQWIIEWSKEKDVVLDEWVESALSAINLSLEDPPKPGLDKLETLTNIILSQAAEFGPSPRTGGILHKVDVETAKVVAAGVIEAASSYGLSEAFLLAGLSGESRCDPLAINPNNQDAVAGESPAAAFRHMDIGIAQFDGATLLQRSGIFLELKLLDQDQIKAKALDPTWAIGKFGAFVKQLVVETKLETEADPSLLQHVPDGDINILTTEAYNAGAHGAALIAKHAGLAGDWSYGQNWVKRAKEYQALLDQPPTPTTPEAAPAEPLLTTIAKALEDATVVVPFEEEIIEGVWGKEFALTPATTELAPIQSTIFTPPSTPT
jgi:hypothetical protein